MAAIDNLMKRLGYVRLSRYGLLLTPEGRVVSLRPAVLDDGLGARVVGWPDGDLAAMELERWEPARPAPAAAVARPAATPSWPAAKQVAPVSAQVAQPGPESVQIDRPPAAAPDPVVAVPVIEPAPAAPVVATKVAPVAVVEEDEGDGEDDEWLWTIALARARAEEAVIVRPTRRMRADTVPPPVVAAPVVAAPVAAAPDPIDEDAWPKTEPLSTFDYLDEASPTAEVARVVAAAQARRVTLPARAPTPTPVPQTVIPVPSLRATVIPVPSLPAAVGVRIAPVVRVGSPTTPALPRRFAKGTGPVVSKATLARPVSDDTVRTVPVPSAVQAVKRASQG